MFFDSLNIYNLKNSQNERDLFSYKKGVRFPSLIILLLVCVPFVAVLNDKLFQLYFYEGYGFRLVYYGSIIAVIVFFLASNLRMPIQSFKTFIYIILTLVYCIVSARVLQGGYRYIGVVMNTMGTVVVLSNCRLNRRAIAFSFGLLLLSGFYCAINSQGYYEKQVIGENVNSNYIALFGVVVLVYGNVLLCYLRKKETLRIQIVRIILAICSFYIIWECKSRGSLLAWLFFIIGVYVVPSTIIRNRKVVLLTAIFIEIVGVAFTYIYVTRLNVMVSTFMGKSTSTRYRLWSYFWNNIFENRTNLILGYGTHSELRETFGYGLHNIYIGIWYDVGFIGLILFMYFIIFTLRDTYDNVKNLSISQLYVIVGFLSFMVSDYFAVTFTGPLVIWNYALLGMSRTAEVN